MSELRNLSEAEAGDVIQLGYVAGKKYGVIFSLDGRVIPINLGLRRDLLSLDNASAFAPYLAFGGGAYWVTNVRDGAPENEEVMAKLHPGAYAGGGINFFLSRNFALNLDLRYHLVNLDPDNDVSGLEMGFGINILLAKYRKSAN